MSTVLVIPCYNEAERLDHDEFRRLASEDVQLVFVDDGSADSTRAVLEELVAETPHMSLVPLSPNRGKAEAVRQGMLRAMESQPELIGFIDADLATPIDEVLRLCALATASSADAIIGSRIAYLGADIDRKLGRHFLGRVFATAASIALQAPVYDTQCGAKFFRNNARLEAVLSEQFHSRWAFDVELLGRLLAEGAEINEVPLQRWVDVPGSKIGLKSMIKAGLDLVQIRNELARRRRQG